MNIALSGGGTAGHVNPLIATAQAITDARQDANIVAVGTAGGLEEELVTAAGFDLELIERVPFPRRLNGELVRFPTAFRRAVRASRDLIRARGIDVVVGFGGYASTPMYVAARREKIPFIVHEGNARPGLANRLGARHAHTVALTFPSTPLTASHGHTVTIGLPMRAQIAALAKDEDRVARRSAMAGRFDLDPDSPILLVTGGSSGAAHLNEQVAAAADAILAKGIQILHITGRGKDDVVRQAAEGKSGYTVLDYLTTMEDAYAVCDLAITRAGAGMVAEVSALGIPAIFVPLPIGNGEQALNARDVVNAGGAIMVDNSDFTADWIRDYALDLFEGDQLAKMSARASSVSPLDAAHKLAHMALNLVESAR